MRVRLLAAPLVLPLVLALAVALVAFAPGADAAGPPTRVVVKDGRTSPPGVDISRVALEASWYWTSEQHLSVRVPHGFRAGQRLTVWFDVNGDSRPDGHYQLRLRPPRKAGGAYLRLRQEFRRGGGWSTTAGTGVRCGDDGDGSPVTYVRDGARGVELGLDLWSCVGQSSPAGSSPGAWRASVRLAKGGKADMAPSRQRWSPVVAGWGPCDPSGGTC